MTTDEYIAYTILEMVKDHKKNCKSDCGISLFTMLEVWKKYSRRKPTDEEFSNFL